MMKNFTIKQIYIKKDYKIKNYKSTEMDLRTYIDLDARYFDIHVRFMHFIIYNVSKMYC
jgi:hypothetical protein